MDTIYGEVNLPEENILHFLINLVHNMFTQNQQNVKTRGLDAAKTSRHSRMGKEKKGVPVSCFLTHIW